MAPPKGRICFDSRTALMLASLAGITIRVKVRLALATLGHWSPMWPPAADRHFKLCFTYSRKNVKKANSANLLLGRNRRSRNRDRIFLVSSLRSSLFIRQLCCRASGRKPVSPFSTIWLAEIRWPHLSQVSSQHSLGVEIRIVNSNKGEQYRTYLTYISYFIDQFPA